MGAASLALLLLSPILVLLGRRRALARGDAQVAPLTVEGGERPDAREGKRDLRKPNRVPAHHIDKINKTENTIDMPVRAMVRMAPSPSGPTLQNA